jgi:hypothetical protein
MPLTQGFGENPQVYARFGLAGHNGLDFGVPPGTPVRAAADGAVQYTGDQPQGYGLHVRLAHEGFITLYAHLERLAVQAGQAVAAGELIGWSGNSGFSSGPHLHFEVRLAGQAQNGFGGAVDPLPRLAQIPELPAGLEAGAQMVTITALNLRMEPSFDDSLRGRLRPGDVVTLAGAQQASVEGYTFVPVVLWVALEYLQPQAGGEQQSGQKRGDFHILHDLSTVFHSLSTFFACRWTAHPGRFLRKRVVSSLKKDASRWPGCQRTDRFSTILSTGGQYEG